MNMRIPINIFTNTPLRITKTFGDELEQFFEYELALYPLSLFDAIDMRKTQKLAIYDFFKCVNIDIDHKNTTYIIDGGYLLHRVVWDQEETFDFIFDKYVHYIHKHLGCNVIVVFDGFNDYRKITIAVEQNRQTTKINSSCDIIFDRFMTVPTNQQQFLANTHNKSRFISILSEKLTTANIFVKQANNDADVLIIETALEQSNTNKTIVVGEDVDLLIILISRTPIDNMIYFLKPGKGQTETKIYSSQSLTSYSKCQAHILFLHAITGCDTTSALYQRGKTKVFQSFEKCQDLFDCAEVFKKINSSPDIILTNEILQVWLGNELNPEDWGWVFKDNGLEPIQTLLPPALEKLLNTIFCNCKKRLAVARAWRNWHKPGAQRKRSAKSRIKYVIY
ncbi:Uncharacterized protein FWK35_00035130 [Aphis craccivora]|uniref:Uncharacterized protein n=1 Tax=Aphis craccivora TaxID=307492 RepID=A0A6G0VW18_APHCR|nr:Uncharacterized protein FWK35_00035130 [Aphis craccivora]